jgi:hypothetical protein
MRGGVRVTIGLRRSAGIPARPRGASLFRRVLLQLFTSPRAAGACGDKRSPVHARARLVLPRGSLFQLRLDVLHLSRRSRCALGERPRIVIVVVGVGSYGV